MTTPQIITPDGPLLVGDYTPKNRLPTPICGRRNVDGLPVVLPGLTYVCDHVSDPEVLRSHAKALVLAAEWLESQ